MADIKYKIDCNDDHTKVFLRFTPVLGDCEVVYSIERQRPDERPVRFFTATTDMKDWIGKVRKLQEKENGDIFVDVEGIYRGKNQVVRNVKVRESDIRVGSRVMVTEHLNVAGGFDLLATKKRILDLTKPDLSFLNIGWSTDKECRYLRVDPYTGETKECVQDGIR